MLTRTQYGSHGPLLGVQSWYDSTPIHTIHQSNLEHFNFAAESVVHLVRISQLSVRVQTRLKTSTSSPDIDHDFA